MEIAYRNAGQVKKLITFIFNDLSISYGPAVHFLELWNAFHVLYKNEFEVTGYSPYWSNKTPIKEPKFKLHSYKVPSIPLFRQIIIDFIFSIKIVRHRKDIIYIRASNYSFFIIITLVLFKIKPYLELNGIVEKDNTSAKKSFLYKLISNWQEKVLLKLTKGAIAVSEGIEDFAKKNKCRKTLVIPNGISSVFFELKQKNTIENKIVYVGTFTSWDGSELISNLAKKFPYYEFHLIGEGPGRKEVEKKSSPNMIFHGYVKYQELLKMYEKFDAGIVLYPKGRNDMKLSSLKTLEYIGSGLPIFTTNVPGQEFIQENNIGICTNIDNLISDFETFIKNLAYFKKNIEVYRKNNKNKLTWQAVAKSTKSFITTE